MCTAIRDTDVFRHRGSLFEGSLEVPLTSRYHGVEGFKEDPELKSRGFEIKSRTSKRNYVRSDPFVIRYVDTLYLMNVANDLKFLSILHYSLYIMLCSGSHNIIYTMTMK